MLIQTLHWWPDPRNNERILVNKLVLIIVCVGAGGNGCVDKRKGACYNDYRGSSSGRTVCGTRLGEEVGRSACCCGSGQAWGPQCEPCPAPGSANYKIVCPGGPGFQPNEETVILEDINECGAMTGLCDNGRCSNTFGSFMCSCRTGYRLNNQVSLAITGLVSVVTRPWSCRA